GAILCFCRSLGEFGATITVVGNIANETRTLHLALYCLWQQRVTEAAIQRLIVLSLSVAFLALWFAQWFHRYQKKRLGR
ncbi:MAG: molybdate ABC transporter permease subunit, partial [Acinetobacter sp.]|nr:molybdate ABC transporter permease subunit [Acinetobacter sp.]